MIYNMRDARIRLLVGNGIGQAERKAAQEAAESFRRFGLKAETVDGPESRAWRDRCRQQVFELVFGSGMAAIDGDRHFYSPVYPVPNDGALLAGVTAREIGWRGGGTFRGGFSIDMVGCVVSVSGLRPVGGDPYRRSGTSDEAEAAAALRLALQRELGHALIGRSPSMLRATGSGPARFDGEGNCLAQGCILQNADGYVSHLRSLAGARAEFCSSCADLLRSRVSYIDSLGCA
jgi:hypothetical protein